MNARQARRRAWFKCYLIVKNAQECGAESLGCPKHDVGSDGYDECADCLRIAEALESVLEEMERKGRS